MSILEPPVQSEVADSELGLATDPTKSGVSWLKFLCLLLAKYCGCFAFARFVSRKGIAIIGWHGVSIADEHTRFPEYFISQETLAQRIRFLQKHFEIISLEEAMSQHASGNIKPRQVVLTFDDGLYDYTAAAIPILDQFNATGTLYTVSSKIGNEIAYIMAAKDIVLRHQQLQGLSSTEIVASNQDAMAAHQKELGALDPDQRVKYLYAMADEYDIDFAPIDEQRIWNHHQPYELRELVQSGHGVQVHTHTHATTVQSPDTVYEEASRCRDLIEDATDIAATDFCYPSGLWQHSVWEDLERAGMRSAVTCKSGPNFAATPALAMRRYLDHSNSSQLEFESIVSGWNWLIRVIFKPSRFFEPGIALNEDPPYI